MANVVDLFSGDLIPEFVPEWAQDDFLGAAIRAGIPLSWLGWCKDCPLLEVCSADECGRLGFSVSVNDPVKYGWGKSK